MQRAEPRLLPLTRNVMDALKMQLLESQGEACDRLHQYTEHLVATYARPHWAGLENTTRTSLVPSPPLAMPQLG